MKRITVRTGLVTAAAVALGAVAVIAAPRKAEAAWVNVKKAVQSISSVRIDGQSGNTVFTTYIVPGAKRVETDTFVMVSNEDGCTIVDPSGNPTGECGGGPTPDPAQETLESFLQFQGAPSSVSDVAYQGRIVRQLEFVSSHSETSNGATTKLPARYLLLVDPSSQLPIRCELWINGEGWQASGTWDYHFNVEMPTGVFDTPTKPTSN